jgi:DNA-binding MarR family transcriptional regulator
MRAERLSEELAAAITEVARLLIREGVHVNRTSLSVLATLRDGPKRITDLAASEFVSQPGMTALVTRLEEQGWVKRQADPCDGRAVLVAITRAGTRMVEAAIAARTQVLRTRIDRLSTKERQVLADAVDALRLVTQDEAEARPARSGASAPSGRRRSPSPPRRR